MKQETRTEGLNQLRLQLEMVASRDRDMRERCRRYNPQPFHEMTPEDARMFALRQAEEAATTIRMSKEEMLHYASEVYASIMKMNREDKRWRSHMRYLEECRKVQAEAVLKQHQTKEKRQPLIIIK